MIDELTSLLKDVWTHALSIAIGAIVGLVGWIWRRKEKDDSDQSDRIKELTTLYHSQQLEIAKLKAEMLTRTEFHSISDKIMDEVAEQHSELRKTVESCSASISATVMDLAQKVAHLGGRMDASK